MSKASCWVSRLASLRGDEMSYAAAVSRSNALTKDTARLPSAAASCAHTSQAACQLARHAMKGEIGRENATGWRGHTTSGRTHLRNSLWHDLFHQVARRRDVPDRTGLHPCNAHVSLSILTFLQALEARCR